MICAGGRKAARADDVDIRRRGRKAGRTAGEWCGILASASGRGAAW
jgi:hypothetical protein